MAKRNARKKSSGTKPRLPPQAQKTRKPQGPKGYYFVVSGEVEYVELNDSGDQVVNYAKTNGIHVETIAPGKPDGITVRGLAQIQTLLQMHFHRQYSKTHTNPPTITNVTILSVSHLGTFTEEEFYRDAPQEAAASSPQQPAEPTLPSEPAEQTLPQASPEASTLPQESEQVPATEPIDYLAGERSRADPTEFEG